MSQRDQSQPEPWQAQPVPRGRMPAGVLSLGLHLGLALLAGLAFQAAPRGTAVEPDRPIGLVLVQKQQGQLSYLGEPATDSSDHQSPADSLAPSDAFPTTTDAPTDISQALDALALPAPGAPAPGGIPSAGGFAAQGSAKPPRRLGKYEIETGVFGVTGTGSRFVYVFDRSGSMEGYQGRPLAAAKSELLGSLQSLGKTQQFQIIFYNEKPQVFNPNLPRPPTMMFGDDQSKRLAEQFVRGVVASGGTRHLEAIKLGLNLEPDVLFFLTDAAEPQLTDHELNEIRRRNQRIGATIHSIEFGVGPHQGGSRNFLVRLAQQNSGRHVYVDVTGLPGARR